jgi:Fur family peroxide stress response transcriptional regulator
LLSALTFDLSAKVFRPRLSADDALHGPVVLVFPKVRSFPFFGLTVERADHILHDTNYHQISYFLRGTMKRPSPSVDVKQRMDQMIAKLREHDFRVTPQRLAVLRVLAASEGHPSVEKVYETVRRKFPTTSIATVYKTVYVLKQVNEVLELSFPDGSNRYDGNKPYPHPHLICTRCKKIIDPDLNSLDGLAKEVTKETGFRITTHRVDFFGLCRDCQ